MSDLNLAPAVTELSAVYDRYEAALVGNDVSVLQELFWNSPHALRFGATENLYGFDAIQAFRAGRPATGLARTVLRTRITTYGERFATTHVELQRHGSERVGRQTESWVKFGEGWRVVSAHVSLMA